MIYDICKTVLLYYCVTAIYDIILNKNRVQKFSPQQSNMLSIVFIPKNS
jgi:hypothetical protein